MVALTQIPKRLGLQNFGDTPVLLVGYSGDASEPLKDASSYGQIF